MAFGFGINNKQTPTKTSSSFGFGIKQIEEVPVKPIQPQQSKKPTKSLPVGGSYYTSMTPETKKESRNITPSEKQSIAGGNFYDTQKEVDHIIPVALGGTNQPENLQALKSKKTISQTVYDYFTGNKRLPKDYKPKNRQEGMMIKEWDIIDRYNKGELTLDQARFEVIKAKKIEPEVKSTLEMLPSALKETAVKAGKGIGSFIREATIGASERFGKTLGTAASVISPTVEKNRQSVINQAEQQFNNYISLAKRETDPNKKKIYLQAAQKSADVAGLDIFNNPEYQKTAKQIYGEGFEVALDVATAGVGEGAVKALKEGTKQGLKATAKQLGKESLKQGLPIGAGYGLSGAMQEDKNLSDTLKSVATGGALGAGLQFGLGALGKGLMKAKEVKNVGELFKKAPTELADIEAKYGVKVEPVTEVPKKQTLPKRATEEAPIQSSVKPQKPVGEALPKNEVYIPKQTKKTLINDLNASVKEQRGIYTKAEKKELYDTVVKPKVDALGRINKDEAVVFYQGTGKDGQYVNTKPSEIWGYNVDDNLVVKKVKKEQLQSTGYPIRDNMGYRKMYSLEETTKTLPKLKQVKYIPTEKPIDMRKKTTVTRLIDTPTFSKKIEKQTVEKGLVDAFKDLPDYDKVSFKDQATKVEEIFNNDPQKAVNIALGKELPTNGALPESVLVAVKNKALKEGDTDLLIRLATEEGGVARESTVLGQRIKMLDEGKEDDAFKAIRDVVNSRRKAVEEKSRKKVSQLVEQEVKGMKEAIKNVKPTVSDWTKFVDEITC